MVGTAGVLRRPYANDLAPKSSGQHEMDTKTGQPKKARQMLLSAPFLTLLAVTFVAFLAFQVTLVHLVPYASDVGLSPGMAAAALGLFGGASVPGRFVAGVLAERIGWRKTLSVALGGAATAMLGLIFVSQDWMLFSAVLLLGVCHGMRAVAVFGLLGRFFGTVALGELIGFTIAMGQLMSAPGPYIVGYWYDLGNSYSLMFAVIAAALCFAALMVLRTSTNQMQREV